MFVSSGLHVVEATSFVSPKWVPQAVVAAGEKEVAVLAAPSESFSQSNINCSIEDSLAWYQDVAIAAKTHAIPVHGSAGIPICTNIFAHTNLPKKDGSLQLHIDYWELNKIYVMCCGLPIGRSSIFIKSGICR